MKARRFWIATAFLFLFNIMGIVAEEQPTNMPSKSRIAATPPMHGEKNMQQVENLGNAEISPKEPSASGFHQLLKQKFIDGNAGFMSLVALALVLGLAFCIERIIYLTLAEINTKSFLSKLEKFVSNHQIAEAKELCRNTRGPIASLCYQGLMRFDQRIEDIERGMIAYGNIQSSYLEKGCSWIALFITMAPSLGFLGTVIGMVISFDQIEIAGDISPTIVASGMKVALITTIFGIIVALVLQLFYNYILLKIDGLITEMEETMIFFLDLIQKNKHAKS